MITLTFTLKEAKGLADRLEALQEAIEGEFGRGSDTIEGLVRVLKDKMDEELDRMNRRRIT